ncbi:hypothetical protein [Neptunicella sp. SCSIO 80796]|uniref:hypothetical protein n=1 Tax=Neptunicella plasticusilytica TaxID=3117012 RepID=UPI003A4D425D
MSFDIDQVIKDMVAAVTGSAKEGGNAVKTEAERILFAEKHILMDIAEARLRGEIDDEVVKREAAREKKVLEAELLTLAVMTKATVQRAANAALDVFFAALRSAI